MIAVQMEDRGDTDTISQENKKKGTLPRITTSSETTLNANWFRKDTARDILYYVGKDILI